MVKLVSEVGNRLNYAKYHVYKPHAEWFPYKWIKIE